MFEKQAMLISDKTTSFTYHAHADLSISADTLDLVGDNSNRASDILAGRR